MNFQSLRNSLFCFSAKLKNEMLKLIWFLIYIFEYTSYFISFM